MLSLALVFMVLTIIMPLVGEWRSRKNVVAAAA
jgi:hypothetical protein